MTTSVFDCWLEGLAAGRASQPLSACPFDIGSERERRWTAGWTEGQCAARQTAGTFDHPPEFYEEHARADLAFLRAEADDPVVRILGGYEPLPDRSVPVVRIGGRSVPVSDPDLEGVELEMAEAMRRLVEGLNVAVEPIAAAFQQLAEVCSQTFDQIGAALTTMFHPDWLQTLHDMMEQATAAVGVPEPPARSREREMLAERRRSHRRTNRWGAPPGRR